jgi:hypothetical protein
MGYIYNRGQSAPGKRIYMWPRLAGKVPLYKQYIYIVEHINKKATTFINYKDMKCTSETRFVICRMTNQTHLYYNWTLYNNEE